MSLRITGLGSLMWLTACSQLQPQPVVEAKPVVVTKPVYVDTACDWDEPVTIDSTKDVLSPLTAKGILKHNLDGEAHCGWGAAKK